MKGRRIWLSAALQLATGVSMACNPQAGRQTEVEKEAAALAALKALPTTGSPEAIVKACGELREIGRALAGGEPASKDSAWLCARGYGRLAATLLGAGKKEAALDAAAKAQRLGDTSDSVQEIVRAVMGPKALAAFDRSWAEAADKSGTDPIAALKAVEAAEQALSTARENGISREAVSEREKDLAPLAKKIRRAAEAVNRRAAKAKRLLYSKVIQDNFYDNGLNIAVRTSGPDATTIRQTSILFDDMFIHNAFEKGESLEEMRKLGFKRVIAADGYGKTWTWKF